MNTALIAAPQKRRKYVRIDSGKNIALHIPCFAQALGLYPYNPVRRNEAVLHYKAPPHPCFYGFALQ